MKIRLLLLLTLCSQHVFAFTCYVTFMKGNCWKDYDVTIYVKDGASEKVITQGTLEKNTLWNRKSFDCQPSQFLGFSATFSPKIWKNNKKSMYYKKSFVYLPEEVKKNASAWEVPICFSQNFSEVPIPPQATTECGCTIEKDIPKIKEKVVEKT